MYQDPSKARGEKQEPRLDAARQKSLLLTKDQLSQFGVPKSAFSIRHLL
jgi:hypothetical protein